MIGTRGVLVMFVVASLITIIVLGYSDRLNPIEMCKSAKAHLIDRCAQNGGLSR